MRNPIKNAWYALWHNPRHILFAVFHRLSWMVPHDKIYLQIYYYLATGKRLNLNNPQTFGEKIQWLKLYNHKREYTTWVDKLEVKKHIAEAIGKEYVIPTLGVWRNPDEIEWNKLPNKFVLKTNHDGGGHGIVICENKFTLDKRKALKELRHSYNRSSYSVGREWPYKHVQHKVFAEQYIEGLEGDLHDYKFFCFSGKVKCFKIDFNRQKDHHANYYDVNGNILRYGEEAYLPNWDKQLDIPSNLKQMIEIAEKLAKDQPFIRVDLYNVKGKIYFGEITFFPAGGVSSWVGDVDVDKLWGEWLILPNEKIE